MIRTRRSLGPNLNWHLIVPVVSSAIVAVGGGMLACFVVALINGDGAAAAFGLPALGALAGGGLGIASARRLKAQVLRPRDGFLAVTIAWLAAAAIGAIPFLVYPTFGQPVDAFFESMSGFTTTGSTLIDDIDGQPAAILLWRSLSQWLGGVGIVVLIVALAPATGLATNRVFFAETSGFSADRLTPRIADTAKIIWGIYMVLTVAGFVAYVLAGMTPWDAINHIFTTLATGGYSTHTASIAHFDSLAVELVAIVFMVAAGVNFAFYWRALRGGGIWPQFAEVRAYLLILAGSIGIVTLSLAVASGDPHGWSGLRHAAFSVTSVMTNTGYTTVDFDGWNDYARSHLLLVMFLGGCAGSTAGGLKIIRVVLLAKSVGQEIERQLSPKRVQVLRSGGRVFSEEIRRGVLSFTAIYAVVAVVGTLLMTASGLDIISALSSVAATLNLVGPGLNKVGAAENFGQVSDGGLWILSAMMLIGRLEVFTVLVLLTPAFWRRHVA